MPVTRKSENSTRMKAILEHARPKLSIVQNELDAHPMLLNVKNGVVDLKTGQLLPHNPKLLLSQIANTTFVKTAACPRAVAGVC
jgi:putative DNA primase/helicase